MTAARPVIGGGLEKHHGMDLMTLAGRVVELAGRHPELRAWSTRRGSAPAWSIA